ncbi:MAG: FHA domain-containing protein [Tepidisphaeraceae bacterium]
MPEEKLHINWDDLHAPQVEAKLEQQQAVSGTQNHYESAEIVVPAATRRFAFLRNAIVYLSLFGALGGLLGWATGELASLRPNTREQARRLIAQYEEVAKAQAKINATPAELAHATRAITRAGQGNPYFEVQVDPNLSDDEKTAKTEALYAADENRDFIANLLFYGISGVTIAVLLAAADAVVERNLNGAIIYGSVGAVIGAVGGAVVALLVHKIEQQMMPTQELATFGNRMLTHGVCWGLLGLFLAAAPGIVLRNGKRLSIGMVGGLIGGLIGGLLFTPVEEYTDSVHLSRLVAIVCVGLVAGFASGVIENAIKSGWLKVESGLIAGKQFVLYRNPTFIGAHPMSHIYLFNDPHVGRRHACIHVLPNGFELENLPLGTPTYVNNRAVSRQRLHNGDVIRVGGTTFHFQERNRA